MNIDTSHKTSMSEEAYFKSETLETREVSVRVSAIDKNIGKLIERRCRTIEGACSPEGYVFKNSVVVHSISAPRLVSDKALFTVVLKYDVCRPVKDMILDCVVRSITSTAGIRAEMDLSPSPAVVYLARDQHIDYPGFAEIKLGDKIKVKVLGVRFEVNDKQIAVIGLLS